MTRRELLQGIGAGLAASNLLNTATARPVESLPGTQPLTWYGDLAERLMDGAHEFVARQIARSIGGRTKYWNRDLSSRAAYEKSVEPNRRRFLHMIGAVDPRLPARMERCDDDQNPAVVAETDSYRIEQVRWPVLDLVWSKNSISLKTRDIVEGAMPTLRGDFSLM